MENINQHLSLVLQAAAAGQPYNYLNIENILESKQRFEKHLHNVSELLAKHRAGNDPFSMYKHRMCDEAWFAGSECCVYLHALGLLGDWEGLPPIPPEIKKDRDIFQNYRQAFKYLKAQQYHDPD